MSATPVAFVVAETAQAARDAAEAIVVDYDILPSVTDLAAALDAGVPLVWAGCAEQRVFDWEIGQKDGDRRAVRARPRMSRA